MLEINLLNSDGQNQTAEAISGPSWDNSAEYPGLDSAEILGDLKRAEVLTAKCAVFAQEIRPFLESPAELTKDQKSKAVLAAQQAYKNFAEAQVLSGNVHTYVSCELSCDGSNAEAKELDAKVTAVENKMTQAFNPVSLFLQLTSEDVVKEYLDSDDTRASKFSVEQSRLLKDQALGLAEEDLPIALGEHGKDAWGKLYSNISSSLSADINMPDGSIKNVGLAEAASMMMGEDRVLREAAFRASKKAWATQEEACAEVINSLSGWRLEEYKRRSKVKKVHFLDAPLHSSRISKETLDAMMKATKDARHLGQRVLKLKAKIQGLEKLSPWDLNSPPPKMAESSWQKPTYDEAIDLIAKAFDSVDGEMGDFARFMAEQKWIDGSVGPKKRPGAYCTKFPKSRSPRVYMTYTGGMREVKTLAHELGHAFHNWVMKDMPLEETYYPMTLAETASIFAETVVNHSLLAKATSVGDRFSFLWNTVSEVTGLLTNVAARFEFENELYSQRENESFTPEKLKKLMDKSWTEYYGDTLTENDEMFWASKLHFHISGLSFYNYPYIFGYLFSLGVYAQKDVLGDKFYDAYIALLRDTGRLTAEEVAMKHLNADLTKPDFWNKSLEIVTKNVEEFEKVVNELL